MLARTLNMVMIQELTKEDTLDPYGYGNSDRNKGGEVPDKSFLPEGLEPDGDDDNEDPMGDDWKLLNRQTTWSTGKIHTD